VKTLRRALAIVVLILLAAWLVAQLLLLVRGSHRPSAATVATKSAGPGVGAPEELPREYVLKFHDAMWRRICIYLSSDRSTDEAERKAHQLLTTSIKKAKETILSEAAVRYPDAERVKEKWREQLDQEEEAIWEKSDVAGEEHRPDKR
jgi:hypothetical protein